MKRNRFLTGALAVILLASVLWYGCIFALQSGSEVSIEPVYGNPDALDGVTLEGTLGDGTLSYDFVFKNGEMKNTFKPVEHDRVLYNESEGNKYGNIYMMPVVENGAPEIRENMESNGRLQWQLFTDRIRIYASYGSSDAVFDTGIEIQGQPDEFLFGGYPEENFRGVFWNQFGKEHSYDLQKHLYHRNAVCRMLGGKEYMAVNLPWGGIRLYQVTETEENSMDRYDRYEQKIKNAKPQTKEDCLVESLNAETWGKAELIAGYDADEIGKVLELFDLENKLVVITLSNTNCDMAVLDETGKLCKTDGPRESQIEALVFDRNLQLENRIPVMQLPDGYEWNAEVFRCESAENILCLDIDVTYDYYTRYMQCGAILKLDGNKVQLMESVSYPYVTKKEVLNGEFTKDELRNIVWVGTDDSQSKMAVVWQSELTLDNDRVNHSGGDLYLEIIRDGKTQWLGKFNSDWQQDYRIPEQYASPVMPPEYLRQFRFPQADCLTEYSTGAGHAAYRYW